MLQSIRDNITGWIAWVVVILLSIPFALVGISSYLDGVSSNAVARIGDEEITRQAYQNRYQTQYRQLREMYGDQFDADMIDEERMREQVLEQMVREELLIQHARAERYHVSDQDVIERIRSVPAFQVNEEFSMDRYRALLRNQGMSSAELERNVQRDMLGSVLREGINASASVTDHEITRIASLENQTREFDELRIAVSAFRDRVSASEDEVAAYYDSNQDEFMTEPTVDLSYIELSMDDIRENVEVSEEELRDAWEEEREQYLADEERRARHILIPVEDDEDAALEKAREVRSQLNEGTEFAELAEEYSADSMSAEEGGSLGWVFQGDMVDPVDEAIFSLEPGEVSDPVRSEFGYHVIRVDEVETPEPMPFEEARDELLTELKTRKAEQRYFDLREQLADETFANPDSLTPIADRLGLEVQTVEGVTPESGTDIASNAEVREMAFSPEVRDERLNSDPIELGEESVAVIRVNDYEPATARPLDDVAESIRDALLARKAADQAAELGRELLSGLRDGADAETLAERDGAELLASRSASRQDQELDRAVRRALFRMPRPAETGAGYELVERSDGDVAVIALRSVEAGTTELAEEERERRRNGMQRTRAQAEFNAFVRELRRTMDVELVGREELESEPDRDSPQPAPGL